VSIAPNQGWIASGEHHRIRIVNMEGQGIRDIPVDEAVVLTVAFSSDESEIFAGCSDGQVRRWAVE
jgi:WD40 repeat protein